MRTFGATNTLQASAQTGEDDLHEDTQTDAIIAYDAWTQHPPSAVAMRTVQEGDYEALKESVKGVGRWGKIYTVFYIFRIIFMDSN